MKIPLKRLIPALATASALLLSACGGGGDPAAPAASLSETSVQIAETAQEFSGSAAWVASDLRALPSSLAEPGAMKWHPGHYVVFGADEGGDVISAGLKETRHLPFVKGIVVRSYWRQLEPEKNRYAYDRIDPFVKKAAADGKGFFLLLATRAFTPGKGTPDYIKSPHYDGGVFAIKNVKGQPSENITLWDDDVRYRLAQLIRALGQRYNGHPNFEGIILSETALGIPVEPISPEKKAAFYKNLIYLDQVARAAFPNSTVIRFANYPTDQTPAIVANLQRKGIGWGAPDIFLEDPSAEKYVYPYAETLRGQIPIGMQVEPDSYHRRSSQGPWNPPDVNDLYTFGRDRLHSNYMFWVRDLKGELRPWDKVLAMFNSPAFPATPSGGLEATCPSKYRRCVE